MAAAGVFHSPEWQRIRTLCDTGCTFEVDLYIVAHIYVQSIRKNRSPMLGDASSASTASTASTYTMCYALQRHCFVDRDVTLNRSQTENTTGIYDYSLGHEALR
jgi:hypothetical protein